MGNLCFSFITPVEGDVLPLDLWAHHNNILVKALEKLNL